jgi:hypothetical protein
LIGQHNGEVFRDLLGLSEDRYRELLDAGAIAAQTEMASQVETEEP